MVLFFIFQDLLKHNLCPSRRYWQLFHHNCMFSGLVRFSFLVCGYITKILVFWFNRINSEDGATDDYYTLVINEWLISLYYFRYRDDALCWTDRWVQIFVGHFLYRIRSCDNIFKCTPCLMIIATVITMF